MNLKNKDIIPFSKALGWILLSTLLISGSVGLFLLYLHFYNEKRSTDPKYQVVAIYQSTPNREKIKSAHLAELLNLSIDKPINIYKFNTKEATQALLSTHTITHLKLQKILPGTIYVNYTMREPVAFLSDFTNTVVDKEGIPFPWKPFFTPKRLPEIHLGIDHQEENLNVEWGKSIESKRMDFALSLLKVLQEEVCSPTGLIKRIDLAQMESASYGRRQIVVILEDHIEKEKNGEKGLFIISHILRLNVEEYKKNLINYKLLMEKINKNLFELESIIIDFRISDLCFIQKK